LSQHREFRAVEIAEQGAFGELEFEPVGLEAGLAENALDRLDEIRSPELQRRHIDRDRQARPIAPVEAGPAQDVFAKLDNKAGMFGDRDKASRRDFALHRMDPSRQRLHADQPVAAAIDDRLIDDMQLTVFDRVAERAFEQFTAGEVGVHRRVVDAGAVAALVLGAIERHIGVAQNIAGVLDAAVDDGNADRSADIDAVPADDEWRADRRENAFGYCLQRIIVRGAGHDDGEFVTAEAGNEIVVAHGLTQAPRDVENELVADMVAERIVDVLEMIEIDIEHGGSRSAIAHFGNGAFQPLRKVNPVRQSADGIVQRKVAQLPLAVGDRGGRAPHMANDDDEQQREGNKRQRNERHEADNHGSARPLWPPRQADNRLPLGIGKRDHLIVAGRHRRVDQAEVIDLQMIGDLCQKPIADVFDQCDDRRASVCVCRTFPLTNRYRGNDRRSAQKILKQGDGVGRLG
jgi:hypothetical protein